MDIAPDQESSSSTSLPPTIDRRVAVHSLRSQRGLLLNLTRHCLPSLANSLFAEAMIPQDVYDTVCNENKGKSERCVALLDCVEARVELVPSDFTKVVHILKSEPFLKSLADVLIQTYCTMSSEPDITVKTAPSAISHYRSYLKAVYQNSPISPETKWPPTPSKEYVTLALVEGYEQCRDDSIGHVLQGSVEEMLSYTTKISTDQILENLPEEKWRLCLVEGAPGIGKSTLAWELCRKWEEFPCMQQYSLVVLLRLREKEVQKISSVADLFYSYESEDKKSLVGEVQKSQGRDILFILDGFDELPNSLQQNGFLLNLIKGSVLPVSTVLVTSRPSATAELLTSSCPQKRVEILGFTQESVEAYASSIFSSEPKKLRKFKAYISVSQNPAINSLMYVPLNAAIVVQIYRNAKSNSILPHTFTELYTQLCLTILNRYLKINFPLVKIFSFEDLPSNLHKNFLKLSEVAFEAMKNKNIIFHLPPTFNHFGFLDAVPALYGVGKISYNFLHLTLQEFFAAYYIFKQGVKGHRFLMDRWGTGGKTQWNVVLKFVAGLTKLQYYDKLMHTNLFGLSSGSTCTEVQALFIECLYEAQSMNPSLRHLHTTTFKATVGYVDSSILRLNFSKPLELYALGYCIASICTGKKWVLSIGEISMKDFRPFLSGLRSNTPSVGTIEEVTIRDCSCTKVLVGLVSHSPSLLSLTLMCGKSRTVRLNEYVTLDTWSLHSFVPSIMSIVKSNKSLEYLKVCGFEDNVHLAKDIAKAVIHDNTILKTVELGLGGWRLKAMIVDFEDVATYMKTYHEEVTVDPRISWIDS